MILVIDIGNTNTVIALYDGNDAVKKWRVLTDRTLTADDVSSKMLPLIMFSGTDVKKIDFCIISSVIPAWIPAWEKFVSDCIGIKPLVLRYDTKSGISLKIDNPAELGADRIADSAAAAAIYPEGAFVIDAGTAITLDIVNPRKEYIGGCIMPGIMVSIDALSQRTAQLPRFALTRPEHAIGKNTLGHLRSGFFYGFVGMVDRVIEESLKEVDFTPKIVATGGLAEAIASASKYITGYDADLTLTGLRIIAELNR